MNLFGIHDEEGRHLLPPGGTCLALTDLSANAEGKNYAELRSDINWLVRLQWGYGTTGTIPQPKDLDQYTVAVERFIRTSKGISAVCVGNEPNHLQERPDGRIIDPEYYAEVYKRIHARIKAINPAILVGPAAIAPYSATTGNWLDYLKKVLSLLETQVNGTDFINIHAYIRGATPDAVTSNEKMGGVLEGQYNSFRTYRDALSVVPERFRYHPALITECNELMPDGWVDVSNGTIPAVYEEISAWNRGSGNQKIHNVVMYRWPKYDKWHIEGKQGVIDDFHAAIAGASSTDTERVHGTFIPVVVKSTVEPPKTPPRPSVAFEREIDTDAIARGVRIVELPADKPGWRVKKLDWLNVSESRGLHHIFYDLLGAHGKRVVDQKIAVKWPSGAHNITTEEKKGEPYSANYPMSSSRNDYDTWVLDDKYPSEVVTGIGMGADEGSGFNASAHTSTAIIFQYTGPLVEESPVKEERIDPLSLVHPVVNPAYRTITQDFAEHPEKYATFGINGHNGVDFAVPLNQKIQAVDDGVVVKRAYDEKGFGNYIKVGHEWGETLYAHLIGIDVVEGDEVRQEQVIGWSGNSGNSSGPHLHFGVRPYPLKTDNGYNGYVDPLPYLNNYEPRPEFEGSILDAIKAAASATRVDWKLLASLAWAESSFRPELEDGLFQIGDAAWSDWADRVGATDINRPYDSALVAAEYYKWLYKQFSGNETLALEAWNFGIGNVQEGIPTPAITIEFVYKVQYGRDLLQAIGV
jgi:murein DD-endopeptidase MepM/ murein hydrolase activator NlpD